MLTLSAVRRQFTIGGVVEQPKKKRGPGAPPGNMNALKHGRTSRQLAELGALIAADPTMRLAVFEMGEKLGPPKQRAEDTAALLLTTFLARARQISAGNLNTRLTHDELNSILEAAARADPARFNKPKKLGQSRKNNSPPGSAGKIQ